MTKKEAIEQIKQWAETEYALNAFYFPVDIQRKLRERIFARADSIIKLIPDDDQQSEWEPRAPAWFRHQQKPEIKSNRLAMMWRMLRRKTV